MTLASSLLTLVALLSSATAADQESSPPESSKPSTTSEPAAKSLEIYGYVNVQYGHTDAVSPLPDTSTFELRRARIGARGDLVPQVGFAILWDGADTSLKDAYGALKKLAFLPGVEIRVGQWKTPFGYEQSESDTRLLWVDNSLVVENLARGVDSRDLGAGFVGEWRVGAISPELAASFVNGAGPNRRDDLDEKNVWGRAGIGTALGRAMVRAGASYGYGRQVSSLGPNGVFDRAGAENGGVAQSVNDDTYLWFQTYGGDVTLDTPWVFVAAELIQSERTLLAFTTPTTASRTSFVARGWYAGLYGKTPWNVGPIFRVERFDRNRDTAANTNERYTLGAYADLVPVNARFIFNYEIDASARSVGSPGTELEFAL